MQTSPRLSEAEALMAERRFDEAIAAFEMHLAAEPQDLKALLKLGICHLLNRSRGAFLEVHRRAEKVIARMGTLPADVAGLYELYRGLLVRVGAASMIAGTLVLNQGCAESQSLGEALFPAAKTDSRPQHRYSGGVRIKPQSPALERPASQGTSDAGSVAPPGEAASGATLHRPSGENEALRPPPTSPPPAAGPVVTDEEADRHRPQHRYSGGVLLRRDSEGNAARALEMGSQAAPPGGGDGTGIRPPEPAEKK